MDDEEALRKRILKSIKFAKIIFFIVVAIVFAITYVVISRFIIVAEEKDKMDSQVLAFKYETEKVRMNTDKGYKYMPVYYYEVDGKVYTCKLKYGTPPGRERFDDYMLVYYKSENPSESISSYETKFKTTEIESILFLGFVWIFVSAYGGITFAKEKKLYEEGL